MRRDGDLGWMDGRWCGKRHAELITKGRFAALYSCWERGLGDDGKVWLVIVVDLAWCWGLLYSSVISLHSYTQRQARACEV